MDNWRIERIAYDQFGNRYYKRVYGWGYLSHIGLLAIIAGGVALFLNIKVNDDILAAGVFIGFILIWIGIFLNGVSERKSMAVVDAKCIDIQTNHIGSNTRRSAAWAVRALVEYQFEGQTYQSTPMPPGYATFLNQRSAELFRDYLIKTDNIKIYVDKKLPKRTLFFTPKPEDCFIKK